MCYSRPCTCSCDMFLVSSEKKFLREFQCGAFAYGTDNLNGVEFKTIWMKLPDHALCVLPIEPTGGDRINWSWDGKIEQPTLTPYIIHWGIEDNAKYKAWHGSIIKGRMESE